MNWDPESSSGRRKYKVDYTRLEGELERKDLILELNVYLSSSEIPLRIWLSRLSNIFAEAEAL